MIFFLGYVTSSPLKDSSILGQFNKLLEYIFIF